MVFKAITAPRGCGDSREHGGIYLECGTSKWGKPVESFLICPPTEINTTAQRALGIRPLGVSFYEYQGVVNLIDWVGQVHYANVADFIEEVRRLGLSRKVSKNLDFSRLTPDSKLLMVHAKGHIDNWQEYDQVAWKPCPHLKDGHVPGSRTTMCTGLYWEDVVGGQQVDGDPPGVVRRLAASLPWYGQEAPKGVSPRYTPAIFAAFPITHVAVIRDPKKGTHEEALKAAEKLRGFSVSLEDE